MALDATVGGATANSYPTLAEAAAYFADSLFSTRWDALTNQDAALVTASGVIDALNFEGCPTSETQSMQMPRDHMYDRNGALVDNATIPSEIKTAVFLLSLYLGENPDALTVDDNITRIKVDVIEIEKKSISLGNVSSLPQQVQSLLSPFLASSGNGLGFTLEC